MMMGKSAVRLWKFIRYGDDEVTVKQWLHANVGDHRTDYHWHVVMMVSFILFERASDAMLFKLVFGDKYRVEILDDEDTNWLDEYGKDKTIG
jgi:hypothetical protein